MKTETQLLGNFNELVFEHRHKAYGAYVIRKSYNNNLTKSLLITVALFALFAFGSGAFSKHVLPLIKDNTFKDSDTLYSTIVELKKPEIEHIVATKKVDKVVPKSDNTNYKATDTHVDETHKTTDIAEVHTNGDEHGKPVDSISTTHTITAVAPHDDSNEIKGVAEHMPEFIGDILKFLRDNLRYPELAKEINAQGTVYLSFVVEKDGAVDNISSLRGVDGGCTEEAIRVVKLMPKWKPGLNGNGDAVRVQFNLPVRFTLR